MEYVIEAILLIMLHHNFLLCFEVLHKKTIASIVYLCNTATTNWAGGRLRHPRSNEHGCKHTHKHWSYTHRQTDTHTLDSHRERKTVTPTHTHICTHTQTCIATHTHTRTATLHYPRTRAARNGLARVQHFVLVHIFKGGEWSLYLFVFPEVCHLSKRELHAQRHLCFF